MRHALHAELHEAMGNMVSLKVDEEVAKEKAAFEARLAEMQASMAAEDEKLRLEAEAMSAAEKERGEEDRSQLFMTVTESGGGIGAQIRKMAKLGKAGPKAQMVLLDIAEGGFVKHEGAVDEAAIETLANDYKQGKLELVKFE